MKRKKILGVLALSALASTAMTPAFAEGKGWHQERPALSTFDQDGDGVVTVEEMDQSWADMREDRKDHRKAKGYWGERGSDKAKGGWDDEKPGERKGHKMFSADQLDADEDGVISQDELDAAKSNWKGRHGSKGDKSPEAPEPAE